MKFTYRVENTVELASFRAELITIDAFLDQINEYAFTYNPLVIEGLNENRDLIFQAIKNYENGLLGG